MVLVPGRGQIAGDCCRGGFLFPEPLSLPVYSHTVMGLWAPGFDLSAGLGVWKKKYCWVTHASWMGYGCSHTPGLL